MYCLSFTAHILWLLGYPDQALERAREALTLARDLSYPFSLGFALVLGARLHQFCRDVQAAQEWTDAVMALANERGFRVWLAWGTTLRGWVLAEQACLSGRREQVDEGITEMRQGLTASQAIRVNFWQTYSFALLAEVYGKAGQTEEGLNTLAEALDTVDKTGERWYEAELYRLRGELLLKSEAQGLCLIG